MDKTANALGTLGLVLSTAAWGGLFFVGKASLTSLDPFWFTLVRYTGAAALLMVLLRMAAPIRWEQLRLHWVKLMRYGVLGFAMFGILVFVGLDHSLPSHGAVVMATMPVTAMMLRWAIERQRLQWWAWAVLALSLGGVLLVSGVATHPAGGISTIGGDLTALAGTFGWVLYTRGQATMPQLSVLEFTSFTALLAVPAIVAIALAATAAGWSHLPQPADLARVAPAMLYVIAIATVFAALAFNKGVRQLGATQGIVFINLVPVSALAIGALRGAMPGSAELAGGVLVVSALLIQAAMTHPRPA